MLPLRAALRRAVRPCQTNLLARGPAVQQARFLNLHEYQSKQLMEKYNVRVQKGYPADTVEESGKIAEKLANDGAEELILKAQIHAGGRGKGHFDNGFKGGVKVCVGENRAAEVKEYTKSMLGASLITKQTGPEGQLVNKVLIHEGITFNRELYLAILMDRAYGGPVIVCSPQGGMDIEEVAEKDPGAIHTVAVDITEGIQDWQAEKVATTLGFEGEHLEDAKTQIKNLYDLFIGCDATQVEINPFVVTNNGLVYCVDAKINFDDNAEFRQKDIYAMRDTSMEDAREVEASAANLNYIGLDGSIGCMVNGAGLAMATMDIIQLNGGSPANFLDVGGSATEDQVEEAFRIITSDTRVKALLVNIFGGIMKCDTIATGIVNAARKLELRVPLVVRLEGTNVKEGVKILQESGLPIITALNLDEAARKAVAAVPK